MSLVGRRLEPFVVDRVAADRMRTMAALLDDPVPIHFDVEAVRALGMGDRPVNQGPMVLGYLTELLSAFTKDPWAIRRLRCRFLDNVFADERLVCRGEVVDVDERAGICEVGLEVTADERPVARGSAVVALPAPEPATTEEGASE